MKKHSRQFSRGEEVILDEAFNVEERKIYSCIRNIGGTPCPRLLVINSTSIFSFEPTTLEKTSKISTLRSQRSLLEIGRVTFLKTESFTVHFKTSYGGDQATYLYNAPLEVVGAIKDSLGKLGVKGKHTQNGASTASSSATQQQHRRIQGGSFHERPLDAIKRLEKEFIARPTLTVVRGIMDRYRRLIENCLSDTSTDAEKEAQKLMSSLQNFLMREDVTKTLNSETQILKQRERSEEEIVVERERTRSRSKSEVEKKSLIEQKKEQEKEKEKDNEKRKEEKESNDLEGERKKENKMENTDKEGNGSGQDNVETTIAKEKVATTDTDVVTDAAANVAANNNQEIGSRITHKTLGSGSLLELRLATNQIVVTLDCDALNRKILVQLTEIQEHFQQSSTSSKVTSNDIDIDGTMILRTELKATNEEERSSGNSGNSGNSSKDNEDVSDKELAEMMAGLEEHDNKKLATGEEEVVEEILDYTFVGVPYHRSPGEVYYSNPDSPSQINHARVAEQGFFLGSGRIQETFKLKSHDKPKSNRY